MLPRLLAETEKLELSRFHANALEIGAQDALFQGKWRQANDLLERAKRRLKGSASLDELYVRKWEAVTRLRRKPNAESVQRLRHIRAAASAWPSWETVRDCDRWEAIATQDEKLLTHLYYGSPYPAFRKRLLRDFDPSFEVAESYFWDIAPALKPKTNGEWLADETGVFPLKDGQVLHRLFRLLASDFYRPFRLSSLFFGLYPDRFFDPRGSSSLRIHQTIHRLRKWFTAQGIPLTVQRHEDTYQLAARSGVRLRIPRDATDENREPLRLRELRKQFGDRLFTAAQAGRLWNVTPRAALLMLSRWLQDKRVERSGSGRAIQYKIAASRDSA